MEGIIEGMLASLNIRKQSYTQGVFWNFCLDLTGDETAVLKSLLKILVVVLAIA